MYFGFTNEMCTLAGYEMLKYVSFPVQVMAKSCKLLPNMIMGRALNGDEYKWWQYLQAIGAMVCVTIMHLSDERSESTNHDDNSSEFVAMFIGIAWLIIFFMCDSFTSQYQNALYKKHQKLSQTHM